MVSGVKQFYLNVIFYEAEQEGLKTGVLRPKSKEKHDFFLKKGQIGKTNRAIWQDG
jgi:hypothetical protein